MNLSLTCPQCGAFMPNSDGKWVIEADEMFKCKSERPGGRPWHDDPLDCPHMAAEAEKKNIRRQ